MSCQPLQQHGERGQQEHSRCHTQIGGAAADRRHDILGHAPDDLGSAMRLHRRPSVVPREVDDTGHTRQSRPPPAGVHDGPLGLASG